MVELDHVFICPGSEPGVERLLEAFGIRLAGRGVHRGQGTANTVADFGDAYLELLWGHDTCP